MLTFLHWVSFSFLLMWGNVSYVCAAACQMQRCQATPPLLWRFQVEGRAFFWPAYVCVVAGQALVYHAPVFLTIWNVVSYLAEWFAFRNVAKYHDHDDQPWKRRRKQIAEKLARLGSKLVVVPATSH